MHPNPAFHTQSEQQNLAFARERAFGILAVNAREGGPLLSHIPFVLSEDGTEARFHLVRSNPIARLAETAEATLAINGPDSYVSPDWYGVPDQVPTWNYVAVHLRGAMERLPQEDLAGLLDRQSALFEARLAPKAQWTMEKMTPEVRDRMMRQICPFRMKIDSVSGTWKLGQNKPDSAREAAADHLQGFGIGTEIATLAALMRAP